MTQRIAEQGTTVRAHHPHYRPGIGDIADTAKFRLTDIAFQPIDIFNALRSTADHPVLILGDTGDGQIGFDATAVVKPVGVDHFADFDIDIGAADTLQYLATIAALYQVLGKRTLIEQHHLFARGLMLCGVILEPVLFTKTVFVLCFYAFGREPVRSFPPGSLAKTGIMRGQLFMQRRMANITRRGHLAKRVVIFV